MNKLVENTSYIKSDPIRIHNLNSPMFKKSFIFSFFKKHKFIYFNWSMYSIICETNRQSRFDACKKKFSIRNLSKKKTLGPDGFTGKF